MLLLPHLHLQADEGSKPLSAAAAIAGLRARLRPMPLHGVVAALRLLAAGSGPSPQPAAAEGGQQAAVQQQEEEYDWGQWKVAPDE